MYNLLAIDSQWIMIILLVGIMVAFMVYSNHSQKKRQQETQNMLNAIQPGNKVKTIGGICGDVVEVCPEDNTFVLETGSEKSGKSYLKFDKQAVYQTDAKAVPATEEKVEAPVQEEATVQEATVEEVQNETEKQD